MDTSIRKYRIECPVCNAEITAMSTQYGPGGYLETTCLRGCVVRVKHAAIIRRLLKPLEDAK